MSTELNGPAVGPLHDYGVYLVTDRVQCGERGVVETVRLAVQGGVRTVQLREKNAGLDEQVHLVEKLAAVIAGQAMLLVNDRVDVVLQAQRRGVPVDGVHLGQDDQAVRTAREILGPHAVIGLSANTSAHLGALADLPAGTVDYVGVGAIHPSTTKRDHPDVLGVEGFGDFATLARLLPSVAIGGIGLADVAPLRRAGAAGVAVVSAICAAPDPESAVRALVAAWDSGA